ncbi:MAG: tRNA (guanosine(37)-N1)-methyltransferase TrmD [Rickettsiaceae bacterium]|nr:tRNA (guanosine(37)-N1)-methyltransferase TrmD [Rickettsiaceae bacterium]
MKEDKSLFHVTILTTFPEMFPSTLQYSLAGKALERNIWSYEVVNIRDFGVGRHKNVDDEPYGGGNGLVMRPDVLSRALEYALEKKQDADIYYMSPRGKAIKQPLVKEISGKRNIIIICGRFEGIDERIISGYNACEISLGDFVLSGGEIAAIALIDACVRLLPGVLANQSTLEEESFSEFSDAGMLLEYPLYTRPQIWNGMAVPDVLLSGNHHNINQWRKAEAIKITSERRPDLLKK